MTARASAAQAARDLADARQDLRYPVVLHEIQQFAWATGSPTSMAAGDHAELLAARVVAALRRPTA